MPVRPQFDRMGAENGSDGSPNEPPPIRQGNYNLQHRNRMTSSLDPRKVFARSTLQVLTLVLALGAGSVQAHWPNGNLTKWLQGPDAQNGIDVLVGQLNTTCQPIILADDFLCTQSGYISDIHI